MTAPNLFTFKANGSQVQQEEYLSKLFEEAVTWLDSNYTECERIWSPCRNQKEAFDQMDGYFDHSKYTNLRYNHIASNIYDGAKLFWIDASAQIQLMNRDNNKLINIGCKMMRVIVQIDNDVDAVAFKLVSSAW
jgi:hypothetical protein